MHNGHNLQSLSNLTYVCMCVCVCGREPVLFMRNNLIYFDRSGYYHVRSGAQRNLHNTTNTHAHTSTAAARARASITTETFMLMNNYCLIPFAFAL